MASQSTDDQYRHFSSSPRSYLNKLRHRAKDRAAMVTLDELLEIWKRQGGLCALSGFPLSHELKKGVRNPYNASLDRIRPGQPYTKDNIQIVCSVLNPMRMDLSIGQFRELICAVAAKFDEPERIRFESK